jgi:prepilin-type N-terminal cleavage/methylation domain-containing protein
VLVKSGDWHKRSENGTSWESDQSLCNLSRLIQYNLILIQDYSMKHHFSRPARAGFTLVEMIGVLAIIAVLASMLLPRVFAAINDARVNSAAIAVNAAKSAAMTYFGKFGRFGDVTGAVISDLSNTNASSWDREVLLRGGYLERQFTTRISDNAYITLTNCVTGSTDPTGANDAYDLDGLDSPKNDASAGRVVVQAFLENVALDDARELNRKIDVEENLAASADTSNEGRVKFNMNGSQTGTVKIYLAHR